VYYFDKEIVKIEFDKTSYDYGNVEQGDKIIKNNLKKTDNISYE
jgi:hypothetical protein